MNLFQWNKCEKNSPPRGREGGDFISSGSHPLKGVNGEINSPTGPFRHTNGDQAGVIVGVYSAKARHGSRPVSAADELISMKSIRNKLETGTVAKPGVRGPAVCRTPAERAVGPEHKPFSVAPPLRTVEDHDDPWKVA